MNGWMCGWKATVYNMKKNKQTSFDIYHFCLESSEAALWILIKMADVSPSPPTELNLLSQ